MAQTNELQTSQASLFRRFRAYPFSTDPEFANGLSIILGHPGTSATEAEVNRNDDLALQAKCFYFSRYGLLYASYLNRDWDMVFTRKEKLSPPLDLTAYKAWLASHDGVAVRSSETGNVSQQPNASNPAAGPSPSDTASPSSSAPTHTQEPTYPSSFAHIVELITAGQPIPGIQQIPDTVLTGHDTSSAKPRRLKPWEKECGSMNEETTWAKNNDLTNENHLPGSGL